MDDRSGPTIGIKYFNFLIFMSAIIFKSVVDAFIIKNDPNGPLNLVKYIILGLCILFYLFQLEIKINQKAKLFFKTEFRTLMIMCGFIFLITVYYVVKNGEYYSITLKEFTFLLIPIVFSFCALNIFNLHELIFCAKVALIILGIGYIFEIGPINFTPSNILSATMNISLAGGNTASSNSIFESSAFSDSLMSLLFFFGYYKRGNKKWLWISFFLVLLANKRLMMLFSVVIIVIAYLPNRVAIQNKVLGRWGWVVGAVVFSVSPFIAEYLTTPQAESIFFQKFSINLANFWMGRDSMVMNILSSGFVSHGLGSTYVFQGSLLEIEGVKFLLELGAIGVIVISFCYWKITKSHMYSMVMMLYCFLNINTSTSIMTGTFSWIFYLILLGCCTHYSNIGTDG